jgi:hypothetical protein
MLKHFTYTLAAIAALTGTAPRNAGVPTYVAERTEATEVTQVSIP